MRIAIIFLVAAGFSATPALAEGFAPVHERDRFVELVEGRELILGLFGIRLNVTPDGRIDGRAVSAPVTGSWYWRDGYFCREMDWSGREISYDCQLVEERQGRELRFTVARGAGDSATFRLR